MGMCQEVAVFVSISPVRGMTRHIQMEVGSQYQVLSTWSY